MSIAINSNPERDQYVASAGQTQFMYSFPIYDETNLAVFKYSAGVMPDDSTQQLTLGIHYTVDGVGSATGGFINLTVGAAANDIITVMGIAPIERASVFQDLNPFTVALNQQLNEQTIMQQQTYTYWNAFTVRYNADELIGEAVRPFKRILPMLPDGHVWVGRGEIGDDPDDIVTAFFGGPPGKSTSTIINQAVGSLTVGTWVRSNTAGLYVAALADNAVNAECLGVIVEIIDPTHFVVQQSGYITSGQAIFSGLNAGAAYFLSDITAGIMMANDVFTAGHVSLPVFLPDSATSGWIADLKRGWIIGDTIPDIPCTYANCTPIMQSSHGFAVGDVLYVDSSKHYALAQADNFATSNAVGVVKEVVDLNNFILQSQGYNEGSFTVDDMGVDIPAAAVCYLSSTVAGKVTTTNPVTAGNISRPIYVSEQIASTTGQNAGYVLIQRPLDMSSSGSSSNDFPIMLLFGR